jgi:hypothetical protein
MYTKCVFAYIDIRYLEELPLVRMVSAAPAENLLDALAVDMDPSLYE